MYKKENDFDKNNKSRIYGLMILKGECLIAHDVLGMRLGCKESMARTFYTDMSLAIDMLLYFFLNDEITNCLPERGPLRELLAEIRKEHLDEIGERRFRVAREDIQDIYANRVESLISSSFLDFTVSSFSVFEFWVARLYDLIKESEADRKIRKAEFVEAQIKEYLRGDAAAQQIAIKKIMEGGSAYMSGKGKVDYLFSKVAMKYPGNLQEDKATVELYRTQRNTVHNLGIHTGKQSYNRSVGNDVITLVPHGPSTTNNWNSSIELCRELIKVYATLSRGLTDLVHVDTEAFLIFEQ